MRRTKVRVIAFTGVMLALTILFQSLRLMLPGLAAVNIAGFNMMQVLIGTLVNLCLLITTWNAGILPGMLLSAMAPVAAFLMGQLPIPHMIAVVAVGNAVLCVVAWVPFATAWMRFVLTMLGALAKFGVLSLLVLKLVVPVLLPSALTGDAKIASVGTMLSAGFVWPQLLTAVAGGILAYFISPRLPRAAE